MWINKFIGILIAINQKPPKDITEGILYAMTSRLEDMPNVWEMMVNYDGLSKK